MLESIMGIGRDVTGFAGALVTFSVLIVAIPLLSQLETLVGIKKVQTQPQQQVVQTVKG